MVGTVLEGDIQVFDDLGLGGDHLYQFLVKVIGIQVVEPDPVKGEFT